jgi:hypothetical protein
MELNSEREDLLTEQMNRLDNELAGSDRVTFREFLTKKFALGVVAVPRPQHPLPGLAEVQVTPLSTPLPGPIQPFGQAEFSSQVPGAELSMFIGAGYEGIITGGGGTGLPTQTTHKTPTGLVEGLIETDAMNFADVNNVRSMGHMSVNGALVQSTLLKTDPFSAASSISVSPSTNTTYSFDGDGQSCFPGAPLPPVGSPPPVIPPPICIFFCGGGPHFVSGQVDTNPDPAFTVPNPPGSGSCSQPIKMPTLSITYGLPEITRIDPPSANVNTNNNNLTVTGNTLAGSAGISSASFAGPTSFTGTIANPNDQQETVTFSVPANAVMGNYQFRISNEWGQSNAVNFTVGGPPANIQSIEPPVWQAGTTFPLTILGSGFGNAPGGLTISGAGVTFTTPATVNATGTEIDTTVTVDAASPVGNVAEVSVTPVYAGSNFTCGTCTGGSAISRATAPINAIAAPAPAIILGSDSSQCGAAPNQANAQLTPIVGQRIAFVGCIPALTGDLAVISESWTPSSPSATSSIANFTVSSAPELKETIDSVTATSCQVGLSCVYNPFYFVTGGTTTTFTFSYTLNNGQTGTAPVTFASQGPQGVTLSVRAGTAVQQYQIGGKDVIGLGNANQNATSGIFFAPSVSASATVPGRYSWVQIVTKDEEGTVDPLIGKDVIPSGPGIPGLDTSYPYSNDQGEIGDAPYIGLLSKEGETGQSFAATMYLMWTPQAATNCQAGSACTIPVPLVSAAWSFQDDTVNTLNPSMPGTYHNWLLNACSALNSGTLITPLSKSSDYPMWNNIAN